MKIIYVYDALCGWCYGFSGVINQFQLKYKEQLKFDVISGGMITGGRIGHIGEVAPYISHAYKDVENRTGVKFGDAFLNGILKDGTAIFTSIPPAIALSVFKNLKPDESIQFASALQTAIYYDGIEPENLLAYSFLAQKFGLDQQQFLAAMEEPSSLNMAVSDFQFSKQLGATGFPCVFALFEGTYYKLSNGYVPFEVLENNFNSIQSKPKN